MAKNTLTFTKVNQNYVSEYTGKSGVLQLRTKESAQIKVYGNAGAGYTQIAELRGQNLIRVLNMAGLEKVKFVSSEFVDSGVVNEF